MIKEDVLNLVDVSLEINKAKILYDITLSIKKASIFGIIGSSGSGKTSLMRTMIGFYRHTNGKIIVDGKEEIKGNDLRRLFGFCTQENSFYQELTLLEYLYYFGELLNVPKKELEERCEKLLRMVELWNFRNLRAENLSGGMKRRFDLALSVIHNPKILILDEPTTGLDSLLRQKIWLMIKMIQSQGVTVILSSHLLDEIDYLCDRVCILKQGTIYGIDSPRHIKNLYSSNKQISIESFPSNYRKLKEALESMNVSIINPQVDKGNFIFNTDDSNLVLTHLKTALKESNERLLSFKIERPDLSKILQSIIIRK